MIALFINITCQGLAVPGCKVGFLHQCPLRIELIIEQMPSSNLLFVLALPVIGIALFYSSWLDDLFEPLSELWNPIPADAPEVWLAQGIVIGTVLNDSFPAPIEAFMGLPYAQPPIEQLRWNRLVPLEHSTDRVFKARKYGPMYVDLSMEVI